MKGGGTSYSEHSAEDEEGVEDSRKPRFGREEGQSTETCGSEMRECSIGGSTLIQVTPGIESQIGQ